MAAASLVEPKTRAAIQFSMSDFRYRTRRPHLTNGGPLPEVLSRSRVRGLSRRYSAASDWFSKLSGMDATRYLVANQFSHMRVCRNNVRNALHASGLRGGLKRLAL